MTFSLEVKMFGLCHFITNTHGSDKARFGVLLPNLRNIGGFENSHEARLEFNRRNLVGPGKTQKDVWDRRVLRRERIAFRLKYSSEQAMREDGFRGSLSHTILMDEMAGSFADGFQGLFIKRLNVPHIVDAQALFGSGLLAESSELHEWQLPGILSGSRFGPVKVASWVSVTFTSLVSASVVRREIDAKPEKILEEIPLAANAEVVKVQLSSACEKGVTKRTRALPQLDLDFAAHYFFLGSGFQTAIDNSLSVGGHGGRPVPSRNQRDIPVALNHLGAANKGGPLSNPDGCDCLSAVGKARSFELGEYLF
jgi:hypothetical protein